MQRSLHKVTCSSLTGALDPVSRWCQSLREFHVVSLSFPFPFFLPQWSTGTKTRPSTKKNEKDARYVNQTSRVFFFPPPFPFLFSPSHTLKDFRTDWDSREERKRGEKKYRTAKFKKNKGRERKGRRKQQWHTAPKTRRGFTLALLQKSTLSPPFAAGKKRGNTIWSFYLGGQRRPQG